MCEHSCNEVTPSSRMHTAHITLLLFANILMYTYVMSIKDFMLYIRIAKGGCLGLLQCAI